MKSRLIGVAVALLLTSGAERLNAAGTELRAEFTRRMEGALPENFVITLPKAGGVASVAKQSCTKVIVGYDT